jgi:hypothetical protein
MDERDEDLASESTLTRHSEPRLCAGGQVHGFAEFDGGVAERNACEVSARCHDEQASFLALNRMHGIVTGAKSVQARDYYGNEF